MLRLEGGWMLSDALRCAAGVGETLTEVIEGYSDFVFRELIAL